MSFDLSDMEQGELCHDRYVCLLLDDYVRSVGAAGLNAESLCIGSVLKYGVWVAWMGLQTTDFHARLCAKNQKTFFKLENKASSDSILDYVENQ